MSDHGLSKRLASPRRWQLNLDDRQIPTVNAGYFISHPHSSPNISAYFKFRVKSLDSTSPFLYFLHQTQTHYALSGTTQTGYWPKLEPSVEEGINGQCSDA